jgi:hypothetical protein
MMRGQNAVYRRSDNALWGVLVIMAAGAFPAFIYNNLHTDHMAMVPLPIPKPVVDLSPPALRTGLNDFVVKTSLDAECLAEVIYYEARGEGVVGEKAVAEVVLQRVHDRNYPHTICGVVHDRVTTNNHTSCQFSFACDGSLGRHKEAWTWHQVRGLAARIVSGATKLGNATGNAIAFHSVGVTPSWAESMKMTAQIGNHIFYRRDSGSHAHLAAAEVPAPDQAPDASGDDAIAGAAASASPAGADISSDKIQSQVETSGAVGNGA